MKLEVFGDPTTLDRIQDEWDALASERGRPYSSPVWMLSWWRQVAPSAAQPRFVAGFDERGRMCGIAPFFAQRNAAGLWTYRILGASTSPRAEPLASAEREEEFVGEVVRKLAELRPFPALIRLEGIPSGSPWPRGFRMQWPTAETPKLAQVDSMGSPTLSISGTYDEWFAARTRNFRQQMRRTQRQLAEQGAVLDRASGEDDLRNAVAALRNLHEQRWASRGGSAVMSTRVERMLLDIVNSDEGTKRLRLWTIKVGDRIISSQAFLSSGGEVTYWLGGFDEAWRAYRPSIIAILAAIQESFARGDRRVDLGGGSQSYKLRFTDGEDTLEWWAVVPPGPTSAAARAALLAARGRGSLAGKLPPGVKRRIKQLVRR
ncbi:MAG: GNAT family N-acetyltransferase [Actinomycetota bacterium]